MPNNKQEMPAQASRNDKVVRWPLTLLVPQKKCRQLILPHREFVLDSTLDLCSALPQYYVCEVPLSVKVARNSTYEPRGWQQKGRRTLLCNSRTSAMVSLSTTCFGRFESCESWTALLCDCGGTRSRSCTKAGHHSDNRHHRYLNKSVAGHFAGLSNQSIACCVCYGWSKAGCCKSKHAAPRQSAS